MYYALIYKYAEDYVERRAPHREAHLALARAAHERGELVMAGVLDEPMDTAIFIWRTEQASVVEEFVRNDPYAKAGLIKEWRVRPYRVAIGG